MAGIAGHRHGRSTSPAGRPSSPSQWVEQWTAASLDSPAKVCQQLFAPALAAAFKADTGHSCLTYYRSLSSSSFRIRHVLQDGPTRGGRGAATRPWPQLGLLYADPQPRSRRVEGGRRRSRRLSAATIRPSLHRAAHDGHIGGWATCGNESRPAPYAHRSGRSAAGRPASRCQCEHEVRNARRQTRYPHSRSLVQSDEVRVALRKQVCRSIVKAALLHPTGSQVNERARYWLPTRSSAAQGGVS